MSQRIPCKDCAGSGKANTPPSICPACNGKKIIVQGGKAFDCFRCRKKGYIEFTVKPDCRRCNGEGYLRVI